MFNVTVPSVTCCGDVAVGLAIAVAAALPLEARAAGFEVSVDPRNSCSAIQVSGELKSGDFKRFAAAVSQANTAAPLRRLHLDSSGGDLRTALAMSALIRSTAAAADTIVGPRQMCNSACVVVLASGARRLVSAEATVIVHQAADAGTGKPNAAVTVGMGHYLVALGFDPQAEATMRALKPGKQLALTPTNARRLGFGHLTFYGGSRPPMTPGCAWGGRRLKN